MNVTYNQILSAREALGKLSDKPLQKKEAVHLARLIKKLNSELEIFTNMQRDLFAKYGKADDNGGYQIEEKNQMEFSKQFEELLGVEIEIGTEKVCISSDINIEASVVIATEAFVEFKTE